MTIEELPHFIKHEIEYEDGSVVTWKFFLQVSRDAYGKWSIGYVHYASDEVEDDTDMVIPQLYFNGADTLKEVAIRMNAKLGRFEKLSNS